MEALELIEILSRGEDSKHQFKENVTNADSLASEMVAFSNSAGGLLVIGANDIGEVRGLTQDDIRRVNLLISNTATNNIRNPINVKTQILTVGEANVILVQVDEGIDKPYLDNNGVVWVKNGSDKRRVTSREELRRLFQSSDLITSDKLPVNGSNLNDIEMDLLAKFYEDEYDDNIKNLDIPVMTYLENSNLAKEGHLNLAGLLLFGENPQKFKPEFIIKAVNFVGNDVSGNEYRDSEDIDGNLLNQFKNSTAFITRNLRKVQNGKGINSLGEMEIPEIVIQEILVNAILHRNYFIASPIRLFIFDNRIEIITPGTLPNSLTVDNIKSGVSVIRNPMLVSFGTKLLPYRGIGTGIIRALKNYTEIEFINNSTTNTFTVIISRPPEETH